MSAIIDGTTGTPLVLDLGSVVDASLAASLATAQAEVLAAAAAASANTAGGAANTATGSAATATAQAGVASAAATTALAQAGVASTQAGVATTQAGVATTGSSTATAQAVVASAAAATATAGAAIQNVLPSAPSGLPFEVTAISGGVGTGTGGTPGEYALGVTGGPPGHKAFVTIGSDGKIASYRNANPGLSIANSVPTYSLAGITGLTGATVPTATVDTIPVNRVFNAPSVDGGQLLAWGNNEGVLATAPFGGRQTSVPANLFDVLSNRFAYGKQVAFGVMDGNLASPFFVTTDGYSYALKPAIGIGAASNGLTWSQDALGFWRIQLGSAQGQLPLGGAGDNIDTSGTRYYKGQQVIFAMQDASGLAGLIITIDGKAYLPKLQSNTVTPVTLSEIADSQSYLFSTASVSSLTQVIQTSKATGAATQITSSGNNSKIKTSYDGSKILYSSDRSGVSVSYWQPVPVTGVEYPVVSRSNFTLIGDSRTVYMGPTFAALYPTRATDNEGVSGQWSAPIAGRFGAVPVTLNVTGGVIPASGNVTAYNLAPNLYQQFGSNSAIHGTIQGVPGNLIWNTGTGLSFTRDTAGSSVTFANPVTFTPDSGTVQGSTTTTSAPLLSTLQGNTLIIGPGYNDLGLAYIYGTQTYSQAATLANIAAIVAASKALASHFVVLGVYMGEAILTAGSGGIGAGQSTLGLAPNAAASASMFNGITALNAALAAAYPANYVDLQAAFVAGGYGESATINGVAGCTILNATALTDGTHPTTAAPLALVTGAIKSNLDAKGW